LLHASAAHSAALEDFYSIFGPPQSKLGSSAQIYTYFPLCLLFHAQLRIPAAIFEDRTIPRASLRSWGRRCQVSTTTGEAQLPRRPTQGLCHADVAYPYCVLYPPDRRVHPRWVYHAPLELLYFSHTMYTTFPTLSSTFHGPPSEVVVSSFSSPRIY
jgi:hypothetical protein